MVGLNYRSKDNEGQNDRQKAVPKTAATVSSLIEKKPIGKPSRHGVRQCGQGSLP